MSKKPYFGSEVDQAIDKYAKSDSRLEKERLFSKIIYPALDKLAENVIHNKKHHNHGINNYQDSKHECVVHLLEKLEKFDIERGLKGFSYFNRIAINWVWANMRKVGEDTYGRCEVESIDLHRNLDNEIFAHEYQEEMRDFCLKFAKFGMEHLDYFYFYKNGKIIPFQKKDKQILDAIFNLFENSHSIDIFNKKALYIMIREQVNVKTQSITDVVNVLRPIVKEMYLDFKVNGTRYWHRVLYYPEEIESDDTYIAEMFTDYENQ